MWTGSSEKSHCRAFVVMTRKVNPFLRIMRFHSENNRWSTSVRLLPCWSCTEAICPWFSIFKTTMLERPSSARNLWSQRRNSPDSARGEECRSCVEYLIAWKICCTHVKLNFWRRRARPTKVRQRVWAGNNLEMAHEATEWWRPLLLI